MSRPQEQHADTHVHAHEKNVNVNVNVNGNVNVHVSVNAYGQCDLPCARRAVSATMNVSVKCECGRECGM